MPISIVLATIYMMICTFEIWISEIWTFVCWCSKKVRISDIPQSVWNLNKKLDFRHIKNLCLKSWLFENGTVIECLKSILVGISVNYSSPKFEDTVDVRNPNVGISNNVQNPNEMIQISDVRFVNLADIRFIRFTKLDHFRY